VQDELLTSAEVARLLRVHPKHLYRLLRQGLPGRRAGRGHWRFRRDEVLAWLGAREASSCEALVEAELAAGAELPAGPEPCPPARVVLGRVGDRWVAHPLALGAPRSADGLVQAEVGGSGSRRVRASLLAPRDSLAANVLVAGCAPVLSVVLDRLERAGAGRGHWIHANSTTALRQLAEGSVHVAGIHLEDHAAGADHRRIVRGQLGRPAHLVRMVRWRTGLALSSALARQGLAALLDPPHRWVLREPGAGSSHVLERSLARLGVCAASLQATRVARDHREVARAVALGAADVGVCIEPVALEHGLRFVPLAEEGFDLVIPDDLLALPHVARLLHALDDALLRREIGALGSYDAASMGHATAA
jgi:putative molybdopterin biosynthesis protein